MVTLSSDRVGAIFAGPDPDCLFKGDDEYFAVTDPARFGAGLNRFDNLAHQIITHGDFHLDLGYEVDYILGATVQFRVPFLPTDRKSTRLNSSHGMSSRMPSYA